MARTTDIPLQYDPQTMRRVVSDLERQIDTVGKAVGAYTVTGFTRVTSLDMATATVTDIGNFLCTLVQDLQKARRLGGG